MAHDFFLTAKIASVAAVITCQVVARGTVSDKNGVIGADGFTLSFKSEVRVKSVNHPDAIVGSLGVHRGFVKSGNGRVGVLAFGHRADSNSLFESIWIGFDFDFLTVTHDVVAAENIHVFNTSDLKDSSVSRANTLITGSCAHVLFLRTGTSVTCVKGKPSVCLFVLKHEAITVADQSISRVSPRHFLVVHIVIHLSLAGWELARCLFGIQILLSIKQKNQNVS